MNYENITSDCGTNLWLCILLLTTFYGVIVWVWLREYRPDKKGSPLMWLALKVWFVGGYSLAIVSLL